MSYPTSSGLKILLGCWALVFLLWFILSIVLQSKDDDETVAATTTAYNIQLLAVDIVLVAITMAACFAADWHRSCAFRSSAKYASFACFLVWFIALMPLVADALRRESCEGDFYCRCLKTSASLACICVILHFFTWLWALFFDHGIFHRTDHPVTTTNTPGAVATTTVGGRHHDTHVCDATNHSTLHGHPVIYGLFILSLIGLFIWAIGVFIMAAGNSSEGAGFSSMPASFFALFFALVCALVPLAHRSSMAASITFWWTFLTFIYGWSLIIVALRVAHDADCSTWDCRSNITSISGAAILVFSLTLLAIALFFFHMFQTNVDHPQTAVYSAPMSSHTGVTHTETPAQHTGGYVDRTTTPGDTTVQRYG